MTDRLGENGDDFMAAEDTGSAGRRQMQGVIDVSSTVKAPSILVGVGQMACLKMHAAAGCGVDDDHCEKLIDPRLAI